MNLKALQREAHAITKENLKVLRMVHNQLAQGTAVFRRQRNALSSFLWYHISATYILH